MRRIIFALGFIFLAGGWGTMEYAKEQNRSLPTKMEVRYFGDNQTQMESVRYMNWWRDKTYPSSRHLFSGGAASISLGAGLVAFSVFPMFPLRKDK